MALSADELAETVDVARDYVKSRDRSRRRSLSRDFAAALVQVADACVIGLPCEKHGGAVHGQEAEELRAGVEKILQDTSGVRDGEPSDLEDFRRSLIRLLDRVDARDSLSFLEAADPKGDAASCA